MVLDAEPAECIRLTAFSSFNIPLQLSTCCSVSTLICACIRCRPPSYPHARARASCAVRLCPPGGGLRALVRRQAGALQGASAGLGGADCVVGGRPRLCVWGAAGRQAAAERLHWEPRFFLVCKGGPRGARRDAVRAVDDAGGHERRRYGPGQVRALGRIQQTQIA
jgi:hypothetical protein